MRFFYIRHGEPIYNPDSLTELGKKQAEALARRFMNIGLDEVYSSTSHRAIQTAMPTCKALGLDMTLLDFAYENYAWDQLSVKRGDKKLWLYQDSEMKQLLCEPSVREMRENWMFHPELSKYHFEKGIERIYRECDLFFENLGYQHIRYTGKYKVISHNEKKVAFFAHQGFGIAFISCLLDIPYPQISNHFDICHTGVTIIDFKEEKGYAIPKVLTFSSDSHLHAINNC